MSFKTNISKLKKNISKSKKIVSLLKKTTEIPAVAGYEQNIEKFIIDYANKKNLSSCYAN
jgi:hypothetical protein